MRGRGGLVRAGIGALILMHSLGWVGAAAAADPVAVLTEIRAGQGEVRVKGAGEADWTAPQPLQALRPGDQLRVTADGRAVLAFTGGGAQTVTAATSPLTIQPLSVETGSHKALGSTGRAAALREAELSVLKSPATAHPYYWAPFVLIGGR